jgi:hypothetical protein
MKKLALAVIIGAVLSGAYALAPVENMVVTMKKQPVSVSEVEDLVHMREEEKLARDVYLTLYNKWKMPVFKNISKAESWHMHMIKLMLDKYNLQDPVTDESVGVFKSKKLQSLYFKLVKQGSKSLPDALKVGATIEDLDIYDLQKALKQTDNGDIKLVYANLEKGSRNHMRAFVGILRKYGSDYTPKFISVSLFNNIMSSNHEAGIQNTVAKSSAGNGVIEGKVIKVYQLPGINKNIKWLMADVKSNEGVVKIAVAPVFLSGSGKIKEGDFVNVRVYKGIYNYISCDFKDITSGFEYKSKAKRCRQ